MRYKLEHDIALWHYINGSRPTKLDSPEEANFWLVTLDYRLLSYDSYKRKNKYASLPICVHPAILIQLLQFWVPRTPEFETAVFDTMLAPFYWQDFDPLTEEVTIRILEVLSSYENARLFPKEMLSRIITNDALRNKLLAEPAVEKQIELVNQEVVEEIKYLSDQLEKERDAYEQLKKDAKNNELELTELKGDIKEKQQTIDELEQKVHIQSQDQEQLKIRVTELEKERIYLANATVEKKQKRRFILWMGIIPLIIVLIIGILLSIVLGHFGLIRLSYVFWLALFTSYCYVLYKFGKRKTVIANSHYFELFDQGLHGLLKYVGIIFLSGVGSVIGTFVSEWIKRK